MTNDCSRFISIMTITFSKYKRIFGKNCTGEKGKCHYPKKEVTMDKIVSKIAALGVPGLVLLAAMAISGLAGGAAIVAALAMLGGPLGMLGGLATLALLVLISNALTKYGFDKIFEAVVQKLIEKGYTKKSILEKIDGYLISQDLKRKLRDLLAN
jgi:hypothetical protein